MRADIVEGRDLFLGRTVILVPEREKEQERGKEMGPTHILFQDAQALSSQWYVNL